MRHGAFYGAPNDGSLERVRKRQFPIVGDGIWSWIHLDDAAAATFLALEHDGTRACASQRERRLHVKRRMRKRSAAKRWTADGREVRQYAVPSATSLDRLRKRSGHHLVETDSPMRQELRGVPTRELARDIAATFLERTSVISGPSEIKSLAEDDDGWIVEHTQGSFVVDRRTGAIQIR